MPTMKTGTRAAPSSARGSTGGTGLADQHVDQVATVGDVVLQQAALGTARLFQGGPGGIVLAQVVEFLVQRERERRHLARRQPGRARIPRSRWTWLSSPVARPMWARNQCAWPICGAMAMHCSRSRRVWHSAEVGQHLRACQQHLRIPVVAPLGRSICRARSCRCTYESWAA